MSVREEARSERILPFPENVVDVVSKTEFDEIEIKADSLEFDGQVKPPKRRATRPLPRPATSTQAPKPRRVDASTRPPVVSTGRVPDVTSPYEPPLVEAPPQTEPSPTPVPAAPVPSAEVPVPSSPPVPTAVAPDLAPQVSPPAGQATRERGPSVTGTSGDFMSEVNRVSAKFSIDPANLLAVMRSESSLNPQAVNPSTGASGLIQFMPRTARSIGTTVEAIRQMTAAEQMPYVERFFESVRLQPGSSAGRLYAYVFLPGRANRDVLTQAGESYYEANRGLDVDRDGKITIADLDARLARFGGTAAAPQQRSPQDGAVLATASGGQAAADQAMVRGVGRQVVVPSASSPSAQDSRQTRQVVPPQASGEVPLNVRLQMQVA